MDAKATPEIPQVNGNPEPAPTAEATVTGPSNPRPAPHHGMPQGAAPEGHEAQDPQREAMRNALLEQPSRVLREGTTEAAQRTLRERQEATLSNVRETLSPRMQESLNALGAEIPIAEKAETLARSGFEPDKAKAVLQAMHPEAAAEIDAILGSDAMKKAFEESRDIAQDDELPEGIEPATIGQDLEALADDARRALANPETLTPEYKDGFMKRVTGLLGEKPGKALKTLLKTGAVGGGLIFLILILVFMAHGGSNK